MTITIERNQKIQSLQIINNIYIYICMYVCMTTQQRKICYHQKNHKIYFLQIFETKQNLYDYTIEKYKRKIDYLQKNNTWYSH